MKISLSNKLLYSGHALGLFHEQARYDRDKFVKIMPNNIKEGYGNQFAKKSPEVLQTFSVPYDYGSIMHFKQTVSTVYYCQQTRILYKTSREADSFQWLLQNPKQWRLYQNRIVLMTLRYGFLTLRDLNHP